jgi:hypothetical protein
VLAGVRSDRLQLISRESSNVLRFREFRDTLTTVASRTSIPTVLAVCVLLGERRLVGCVLVGRMSGAGFIAAIVGFGFGAPSLGGFATGVGFGATGRVLAARVGGRASRLRQRLARGGRTSAGAGRGAALRAGL